MKKVPITRQVCCRSLSLLLTRSLCRRLPTSRAHQVPPTNSWGTSPKSHFPVRSVEHSSSVRLWLQRTWKEFSSLGCALSGVPPWTASSQRGFPGPASQKTLTESTPPAWQGARLRIYVLLKRLQQHLSVCVSIYSYTRQKLPSSSGTVCDREGKKC